MSLRSRLIRLSCLVIVAMSLFGCDHATKIAAKATLERAPAVQVAPSVLHGALELRYTENDDIAFSAFHQLGIPRSPSVLIAIGAFAMLQILILAVVMWRKRNQITKPTDSTKIEPEVDDSRARDAQRVTQLGLALIFGGALGNIVDRIWRGYVVDFIHVKGWPVFNVADIAVVCGMLLMLFARVITKKKKEGVVTSHHEK
jgi:lipoprotein signal peptidase